jgi:voltage-gated potassium channel
MIYAASLAILDIERHVPGAHITSFGDALWWSITTVTTVGYGDLTPVTGGGRVVAVAIGGISLVGVVTATLASWIVQRVAEEDTTNQAATRAQIEELREEIQRLAKLVTDNREPAYGEGREGF